MQNEGQLLSEIQKQVQTLLQSPPSYMRQISRFSQKLLSFEIKYIYYAVTKIKKIIIDQYQPIKKKYLAFRFVKDTLLLASHGFYIIIVIQLLGIVLDILNQGNRQADNGLGYLIKKIGPRPQISNAIEIKQLCTTLLQLLTQMMKWCGTHIKLHPYYKIPYTSVFHFYLNQLTKIKNTKVTGLQYFTADNIKTYQQNYLQRQLQVEQESRKQVQFITQAINSYISLPQDDNQHDVGLELLKRIIQTGDSTFIKNMIDCLKQLIESEITGYKAIQLTNQLLKVRQMQFFTLVRDQLLYSVAYFVLMMNKEKFSQIQHIDLIEILRTVYVWKIFAVKMGIQTDTFEEFFKKMKLEWIFVNNTQYTSKIDKLQQAFERYKCFLSPQYLANINREKKSHLKLKDDKKVMAKIQKLVYHKREQDSKKDSFFDDKHQNNSYRSIKKGSELDNDKNPLNQPNPQLSNINYKPSLQNLESNSPIKQLRMNPLGQSYQSLKKEPIKSQEDLIKFNNSMSNLSQEEDRVNIMKKNYDQAPNIYTNRQQNDKKSILSRSSRSNKSSKKSLGKMEKASSLGLGVQRVKSSKLIKGEGNNDPSEIKRNSQKLNIIKFDDSSSNRRVDHSHVQSDNHPYKDEDSRSRMTNQQGNSNNQSTIAKNRKLLRNQQIIIVQQTIKKPKFAFKNQQIDDDLTQADDKKKKIPKGIDHIVNRSIESFKVDPSLVSDDKVSKYSSIPSDFKQVLGGKAKGKNSQVQDSVEESDLNIRFNKFPHKVKQLEMEIEKAKQFQLLYQQKMRQKDQQYEKILKDLPPSHQVVHEENMKLKKELQEKQRKQAQKQQARQRKKLQLNKQFQKQTLLAKIPFLPQNIFPLPLYTPYTPQFTKQMISTKCLLQKNDIFELGYAFKKQPHLMFNQGFSYKICLYFKILVKCDSMKFKMKNGGLMVNEELQARVVNVVANKQMKFQGQVIGYVLNPNRQFQIPKIQIQIVPDKEIQDFINQQRKKFKQPNVQHHYQLQIPCSLFNFIEFNTPTKKPQQIRTTYAIQSQQSCSQLANSIKGEFLLNSFKCGKLIESREQNSFYVSFHTYFKDVKSKKLIEQSQGDKVYFDKLAKLQRKEVNLVIKKISPEMFYIQSDNVPENDKIVLVQICKVIGK